MTIHYVLSSEKLVIFITGWTHRVLTNMKVAFSYLEEKWWKLLNIVVKNSVYDAVKDGNCIFGLVTLH